MGEGLHLLYAVYRVLPGRTQDTKSSGHWEEDSFTVLFTQGFLIFWTVWLVVLVVGTTSPYLLRSPLGTPTSHNACRFLQEDHSRRV